MPWSESDVEQHNHGLTPKQKRQWVAVANSVLAETGDDGEAIRKANAVVRKAGSSIREAFESDMDARLGDRFGVALREASGDDHPYGAWHGGKKSEGGGPGPAPGGKAARIRDMASKVGPQNVGNLSHLKGDHGEGQKPSTAAAAHGAGPYKMTGDKSEDARYARAASKLAATPPEGSGSIGPYKRTGDAAADRRSASDAAKLAANRPAADANEARLKAQQDARTVPSPYRSVGNASEDARSTRDASKLAAGHQAADANEARLKAQQEHTAAGLVGSPPSAMRGDPRLTSSDPVERGKAEFAYAVAAKRDTWVPGAGGTETPYTNSQGQLVQRVFNPKTGEHGYLDVRSDIVKSDRELGTQTGKGPGAIPPLTSTERASISNYAQKGAADRGTAGTTGEPWNGKGVNPNTVAAMGGTPAAVLKARLGSEQAGWDGKGVNPNTLAAMSTPGGKPKAPNTTSIAPRPSLGGPAEAKEFERKGREAQVAADQRYNASLAAKPAAKPAPLTTEERQAMMLAGVSYKGAPASTHPELTGASAKALPGGRVPNSVAQAPWKGSFGPEAQAYAKERMSANGRAGAAARAANRQAAVPLQGGVPVKGGKAAIASGRTASAGPRPTAPPVKAPEGPTGNYGPAYWGARQKTAPRTANLAGAPASQRAGLTAVPPRLPSQYGGAVKKGSATIDATPGRLGGAPRMPAVPRGEQAQVHRSRGETWGITGYDRAGLPQYGWKKGRYDRAGLSVRESLDARLGDRFGVEDSAPEPS